MNKIKRFKILALIALLGLPLSVPALEVHLQNLSPAPGLRPSEALDPLEGLTQAVNCGLDFLNTAKNCGLTAPSKAASPFAVTFDPMLCRLTMRFSIGELIDGMLKKWLAGAFARLDTPIVGALCLIGIGPQFCPSSSRTTSSGSGSTINIIPESLFSKKSSTATSVDTTSSQKTTLDEAQREATTSQPITATPPTTPVTPPAATENTPRNTTDGDTGLDRLVR
ncbi:MAG: hypothetical protein WBQ05_07290 [Candidatus Competibacter denitrificans]